MGGRHAARPRKLKIMRTVAALCVATYLVATFGTSSHADVSPCADAAKTASPNAPQTAGVLPGAPLDQKTTAPPAGEPPKELPPAPGNTPPANLPASPASANAPAASLSTVEEKPGSSAPCQQSNTEQQQTTPASSAPAPTRKRRGVPEATQKEQVRSNPENAPVEGQKDLIDVMRPDGGRIR